MLRGLNGNRGEDPLEHSKVVVRYADGEKQSGGTDFCYSFSVFRPWEMGRHDSHLFNLERIISYTRNGKIHTSVSQVSTFPSAL